MSGRELHSLSFNAHHTVHLPHTFLSLCHTIEINFITIISPAGLGQNSRLQIALDTYFNGVVCRFLYSQSVIVPPKVRHL